MLVRLWWKEWRALIPIMLTLVVAAIGVQWFLLNYGGSDIRYGTLVPIALCWAVLYALAAGSASFAGERENRTLGLLDALPVGRGTLWIGKASFALVSSLALGVVLRVLGTTGWRYESIAPPVAATEPFFALLIVEATIWGLFWSSLSKNAITAGILAVISTAVMVLMTGWLQQRDPSSQTWAGMDSSALVWRVAGMVFALAVSWLVMNSEFRPRFLPRSVSRNQSAGLTQPQVIVTSPSRREIAPTPAFWSVVWQTWREGRVVWLQTLALGLIAAFFGLIGGGAIISLTLLALALVTQGSSIFGLETATGTRAFLDHQAVRPRTVWAGKMFLWMLGLVVFSGLIGVGLLGFGGQPSGASQPGFDFTSPNRAIAPSYLILPLNMFAVAVLAGMIFQRRVTAAMISIVVAVGVIIPQAAWYEAGMIAGPSLLYSPLIWLAVSWFWVGDWLAGRGFRRWVNLALLVVVPYAALFGTFTASRAWGIKDIGPRYGDASFAVAPPDLGNQYRDLAIRSGAFEEINRLEKPDSNLEPLPDKVPAQYLASKQDALAELRALAAQPGSVAAIDAPATVFVEPRTTNAQFARDYFVPLITLDAEARAGRGDLTGAWDDLESLLRMSNHYAKGARSIHDYEIALMMSHTGVARAIEWSKRPGMTVDLIRSARSRLREIGDTADPSPALRYEALRVERSLDQPAENWADFLGLREGFNVNDPWRRIHTAWVAAPPWERERTRRIMRLVEATSLRNAAKPNQNIEFFQYGNEDSETTPPITASTADRSLFPTKWPIPRDAPLLGELLEPFARSHFSYPNELNHRRLLDLFLVLRGWQLNHSGQIPDSVDQLNESDDELPILPLPGLIYAKIGSHRVSLTFAGPHLDPMGRPVDEVEVFGYDLPDASEPIRQNPAPAPSP